MKTLCVYCGSSIGRSDIYAEQARLLGRTLVARKLGLVYGGASVGIMGVVADAVLAAGGRAIGVIPTALATKELAHTGLTELHVTRSMHERKTLMADLADGFVALPGGMGTFEEIFEVLTWAQLGIHAKPCGLLNVDGYFDALLVFLDHAVEAGFLQPQHRALLIVESDPGVLLDRFAAFVPLPVPKWVTRAQS